MTPSHNTSGRGEGSAEGREEQAFLQAACCSVVGRGEEGSRQDGEGRDPSPVPGTYSVHEMFWKVIWGLLALRLFCELEWVPSSSGHQVSSHL